MNLSRLRFFVPLLTMLFAAVNLSAQDNFPIAESFEDGKISDGWTQEYVAGSHDWIVEKDNLTNPKNAYDGKYRVALRNTTTQKEGFKTRLITPVFDASNLTKPVVTFAYAQYSWAGGFDTLRVLYRPLQSEEFIVLKEFTGYTSKWVAEQIELESPSATYQLAFEGTDNLGRGIVLDNIVVRPCPECTRPNILTQDITQSSATLFWSASNDTKSFHIRVSKEELSDFKLNQDRDEFQSEPLDTILTNGAVRTLQLDNLELGIEYFIYIKAVCGSANSGWSVGASFSTENQVAVPYYENFNLPLTGYNMQHPDWFHGTDNANMIPYINTADRAGTNTTLIFGYKQANGSLAAVPAGNYAYAATPEVKTNDISKLQVTFTATVGGSRYYDPQTNRLQVGVMTDPKDKETFELVKEVVLENGSGTTEVIVPLTECKNKTAKHVALMSNSTEASKVIVDNFVLEVTPSCAKARELKIVAESATSISVDWTSMGATACEYVVSKSRISDLNDTEEVDRLKTVSGTSDVKPAKISGLEPSTEYYIYIRNKCSDTEFGAWSNQVKFTTPGKVDVPHTFDFEIDPDDPSTFYNVGTGKYKMIPGVIVYDNSMVDIISLTDNRDLPVLTPDSKYVLFVRGKKKSKATPTYLVFPEMENLKNTNVAFWGKVRSTQVLGGIEVGVMKDPYDLTTYKAVKTLELNADWMRFSLDMSEYEFEGNFLAFAYVVPEKAAENEAETYVDNLVIKQLPACKDPKDFVVEPTAETAQLSWNANGASSWKVRVSDDVTVYDSLFSATYDKWLFDGVATTNSIDITGLEGNYKKYYYFIQTQCAPENNDWLGPYPFTTECYDKQKLPYTLDISNAYKDGSRWVFPCLTVNDYTNQYSSWYPSVLQSKFNMSNFAASEKDLVVALPEMEKSVNELYMDIKLTGDYNGADFEIGTVSDDNTFTLVKTVTVGKRVSVTDKIYFSKCGADAKRIALRLPKGKNAGCAIDELVISAIDGCAEMLDVKADSISHDAAKFSWRGDVEEKWDVVVSKTSLDKEALDAIMAGTGIVDPIETPWHVPVTSNPCLITGLDYNTVYYFYVRSLCSAQGGPWTAGLKFRTGCGLMAADELGVEGFEALNDGDLSTCWTGFSKFGSLPVVSSDIAHEGNNSIKFSTGVVEKRDSTGSYFFSPEINTDETNDMDKYQVSFWGYAPFDVFETNEASLEVGISFVKGEVSSYAKMDNVYNYGGWHYYTVPFKEYIGDMDDNMGHLITLISGANKANTFYVDELKVELAPACLAPRNLKVKDVDYQGATIEWVADQTDFTIRLCDHQLTPEEIAMTGAIEGVQEIPVIGAKTYTFNALDGRKRYYVYVGADCEGTTKWSNVISFKTECMEQYPLPYTESFDNTLGTGNDYKPDCWSTHYTVVKTHPNFGKYPYVSTGGQRGNGLYMYINNASQTSFAIMPKVDATLSECQLSFFAKCSMDGAGLIIGVLDETSKPLEEMTLAELKKEFVSLDTVYMTTDYKKYYVKLDSYDNKSGKRLLFTMDFYCALSGNVRGVNAMIDNVELELIPACQKPETLNIVSVSKNSLKCELTDVWDIQSWEYACVESGAAVPEQGTPITAKTFDITVLNPMTTYDIYVRSVCDASNKSRWIGPVTQTTFTEEVASFDEDYVESFETVQPNQWNIVKAEGYNGWVVGSAVKHTGTKSLYISNDGGTAAYDITKASRSWAYRTMYLKSGVYNISYNWSCMGEGGADYIKAGLFPAEAMFKANDDKVYFSDGQTLSVNSMISLMGEKKYLNNVAGGEWAEETVVYPVYIKDEGYYSLVFYWQNDKENGAQPTPSAVIDDITIAVEPCTVPIDLKVTALDHKSVTLEWTVLGEKTGREWEIFMTDDETVENPDDAADKNLYNGANAKDTTATIGNLTEQSIYYIFLRTRNAADDCYSEWSTRLMIETPCVPVGTHILYGFEEEVSDKWTVADCFVTNGTVSRKQNPQDAIYSHSGDYALYLSQWGAGSYIILPKTEENLDNMQLTFWMRPVPELVSEGNEGKLNAGGITSSGTQTITVYATKVAENPVAGTKIADCVYTYTKDQLTNVKDDMTGNKFWIKYSVPLTGFTGHYIALYDNGVRNMYIDDIIIEDLSTCGMPENPRMGQVKHTSVQVLVNKSVGASYEVKYAKTIEDVFAGNCETAASAVSDTVVTISGLEPATKYFYAVRKKCSDTDMSDWTIPGSFVTAYAVRFNEAFSAKVTVPDLWTRSDDLLTSVYGNGGVISYYRQANDKSPWGHSFIDNNASAHQFANLVPNASNDRGHWLITPAIYLEDGLETHLSFDLAVTEYETYDKPVWNNRANYRFIVIVSDDEGKTWKEENSTVWDEQKKNNNFFALSNEFTNIAVDLTKYAGKTIKVGFYAEVKRAGDKNVTVHIDNLNVNSTIQKVYPDEVHCATYDYQEHGFDIPVRDIKVGEMNSFTRTVVSQGTDKDSVITVNFMVNPVAVYEFNDVMCEGDVYSKYNFTGITTAGRHVQKCSGVNSCDSVVYLNLTVNPLARAEFDTTFCDGHSIIWNGQEYNKAGNYEAVIERAGMCDSVVTMHLTMIPALYGSETHNVCDGSSVVIDGEEYVSDGSMQTFTVMETITRPDYCDSVVTHTVVYASKRATVIEGAICEDEEYNANGFNNITKEGSLTTTNKTTLGCDSVVTLNLIVIREGDKERTVERKITEEQLPYEFYGNTYGKDTKPGTYTGEATVTSESGACSIKVRYTLYVGETTGVDNVYAVNTLVFTPNPINAGETVTVEGDFSDEQLSGMVVDVYGTTGALAQRFYPDTTPITISGLNVSGVYVVRITDGIGEVYIGKIIVK